MYVVFSMLILWQLRNKHKISGAAVAISTNEIQRSSHNIDHYKYNLSWCWTLWVKNSKHYWFHVLYIHNSNRLWQSQKWRHFNMIAAEQKTVVKRKRFDMCYHSQVNERLPCNLSYCVTSLCKMATIASCKEWASRLRTCWLLPGWWSGRCVVWRPSRGGSLPEGNDWRRREMISRSPPDGSLSSRKRGRLKMRSQFDWGSSFETQLTYIFSNIDLTQCAWVHPFQASVLFENLKSNSYVLFIQLTGMYAIVFQCNYM